MRAIGVNWTARGNAIRAEPQRMLASTLLYRLYVPKSVGYFAIPHGTGRSLIHLVVRGSWIFKTLDR